MVQPDPETREGVEQRHAEAVVEQQAAVGQLLRLRGDVTAASASPARAQSWKV